MRLFAKQTVLDKLVDRSGTITLGGTSQQLTPANPDRCYFYFQNLATEDLYINFTTAAGVNTAGSFRVCPGASFFKEGSYVSSEAANVIGATTGSVFTCKENSPSYGNV